MVRMKEAHPRRNGQRLAAMWGVGATALCAVLLGAAPRAWAQEPGWKVQGRLLSVTERRESISTPDGFRSCWFAKSDRPDETMPAVLVLEPRGTERAASRERARLLAGLGAAVLVLQVDGREESTTSTLAESRAAFDWLRARKETSDQPTALVGIGSASGAAIVLASREPRIGACAIDRRVAELAGFEAAQMHARLLVLPAPIEGGAPLGSTSTDALLSFFGETIMPGLSSREEALD